MKFSFVKKSLTGIRAPKTTEAQVLTTPTPGTIRVNANAAEIMGIDYSAVNAAAKEDAGVRMDVVQVGENTFAVVICGAEDGSKLSSPSSKNGGNLQFSSLPAWQNLGGDSEHRAVYTIDADKNIASEDEDGNTYTLAEAVEAGHIVDGVYTAEAGDGSFEGAPAMVHYILEFKENEAKPERNTGSDDDEI